MAGALVIIFIRSTILRIDKNEFDYYLVGLVAGTFCLGIILKIIGIFRPDALKGTLEGFLAFETYQIVAGEIEYKIEEIQKIKITNDDYYGKTLRTGRSFNSSFSNGVNNICEITLRDGRIHRYNYELYYPNDLQKSQRELVNYYRLGKMDINNLADILGLSKSEVGELQ